MKSLTEEQLRNAMNYAYALGKSHGTFIVGLSWDEQGWVSNEKYQEFIEYRNKTVREA